ncbi:MAG: fasciclin domain-containing protein [Pseudomonadota bacterium]|nr:fasciclin domain-containing protein [Pseudomonadota bacterium]
MDPALPLVRNAANSKEHTTFISAVRAAGLESTFADAGSFTFFAPTDEAFGRLPNGTVTSLMDPSNKWLLGRLLRYHVVPGAKTRTQIAADVRAGGGVATYRTVEGTPIRVSMDGNTILVADIHGNRNEVRIADVRNSNGVMHVLNGVLIPTT